MASMEAVLQNKYNIATLYPTEWPAEKDVDSDEDSDDGVQTAQRSTHVRQASLNPPNLRKAKSRYSVLEHSPSVKNSLPGVERTKNGVDNLVQKDEQDPLGVYPSVVGVLTQRGLPVEDDKKLRNRFLLSSTSFSPTLFLSQVHSSASTDSLLEGLDFLSRSIEKKSASLKVLVESNFERFVKAKATIDNVYNEMRDQGTQKELPATERARHSRHASRSSASANRNAGGPLSPGLLSPGPNDKKKNALVKESEYGVQGIKAPLTEVAVKAEEVWGPALGGREKEVTLKAILASVERNRGLFEVGGALQDAIKRRDNEAIIEEYHRARKYTDDARYLVEQANNNRTSLSDAEVHQIIVTARMWGDVETQIEAFKREAWRRLSGLHFSMQESAPTGEPKSDQYMELISVMLELGVEENPIWIWLLSRYNYLKSRLNTTCERSKVEIEILRRHLANGEKPSLRMVYKYFRSGASLAEVGGGHIGSRIDGTKVIEFWEHVHSCMFALLSTNGGLLGEIIEYWEIASSFISGRAQKSLPTGPNNQSAHHHRLPPDGVQDLQKGVVELANMVREHLHSFFSDAPIEDISLLFSPIPDTPTPAVTPRTPLSASLSPRGDARFFRFDKDHIPPPSPSRGEAWEKYAFWAPHSNALSGSHYLSKTLLLIGTAANELASLNIPEAPGTLPRLEENLRFLVGSVRERCMQAVCAAWNTDSENMKVLEDWTRDPESKDTTYLPNRYLTLQNFLLTNLQRIMYVTASDSGSAAKTTSVDVVVPPSSKLLSMVRAQFVASLFRTLRGMVECAEKGRVVLGSEFEVRGDDLTVDEAEMGAGVGGWEGERMGWGKVDAEKQSSRLLVTLSNMSTFNTSTTPHLLTQFETLFSVQLTDEANRIRDTLSSLDSQLFQTFTKPHITKLDKAIQEGIFSPTWAPPSKPGKSAADRDPSPFIFEILLDLVVVHTEVSTTSPSLTPRILKTLFESITTSLITTFHRLPTCSVFALMQATLDVEFLSQTLSSYTTEKASQVQTDIYQVLDQKTDNAARVKLQEELPALRAVLKRLREGTKAEFACFRKRKSGTVGGSMG
ncbi:hypothetical protein GQ43DRAFT_393120 [Delitschia confertaspora ATCC 74209]|uniref:Exocyst complex component SEC5 n=1 Tax=Delitschia confertaspora ATCC 74209 TaxID=1513339 RepID=A0A9P4JM71_9PLEO|nr:hypothetical protein GQ43DRAFT_393120 [Delitschia confertaspora ATCC 74209]